MEPVKLIDDVEYRLVTRHEGLGFGDAPTVWVGPRGEIVELTEQEADTLHAAREENDPSL